LSASHRHHAYDLLNSVRCVRVVEPIVASCRWMCQNVPDLRSSPCYVAAHLRGFCVTVDGSGALQRQISVWRRVGKAGNEPEAGLTDARGPGCTWRACAAPRVGALQRDKCGSPPAGKCWWHSVFDPISASQRPIKASAVVRFIEESTRLSCPN
jgi:hypothetical protein